MKQILYVRCSPRGPAAESDRLAQKIIGLLLQKEPAAAVVTRAISGNAMPHVDAASLGSGHQCGATA
jgi:FMN-dependent NADH-azoreductase